MLNGDDRGAREADNIKRKKKGRTGPQKGCSARSNSEKK